MTGLRHIAMDDGCRIAFEYLEQPGAPGLVFSPSLGTSMGLFDAQVQAFSKEYSILRYDPRGHGASDVGEGSYSLDRLGRDVVQLLDALKIAKAHFAGVSLGGMTGQWLGYRAPERFHSLTLANTSAYMGPPAGWAERIAAVLTNGMEPMVEPVIERWFTPGFRRGNGQEIERVAAMLKSTSPAGYAGCSAAIRDMDLRRTAALIEVSTLVIAGMQDPATPPEHAEFLAQNIAGAKLATLDAAHLSNVELPDQFNAALSDFLGGL